jgi:guanylate kinase
MIDMPVRSLLVVVSAPSGGGKTTLCERLLAEFHQMVYSVSCTTRPPREGEIDGTDYFFISEDEFEQRAKAGEFLEHAHVHGYRYGTLRRYVEKGFATGRDVLMDIDVQGAAQIREQLASLPTHHPLRRGFVDIFIAPPSIEVLRKRLQLRGKDADAVIERRMQQAALELEQWRAYQYVIVNDRLDTSYDALRSIIIAEHHRLVRELS